MENVLHMDRLHFWRNCFVSLFDYSPLLACDLSSLLFRAKCDLRLRCLINAYSVVLAELLLRGVFCSVLPRHRVSSIADVVQIAAAIFVQVLPLAFGTRY